MEVSSATRYANFLKREFGPKVARNAVRILRNQVNTVNTLDQVPDAELQAFYQNQQAISLLIQGKIASVAEKQKQHFDPAVTGKVHPVIMGSVARNEMVPYSDLDMTFLVDDQEMTPKLQKKVAAYIQAVKLSLESVFGNFLEVNTDAIFNKNVITIPLLEKRYKTGKIAIHGVDQNSVGVNYFLPIMDMKVLSETGGTEKQRIVEFLYKSIQEDPEYFLKEWYKVVNLWLYLLRESYKKNEVNIKQSLYRTSYYIIGFLGFQLALEGRKDDFLKFMMIPEFEGKIKYLESLKDLPQNKGAQVARLHKMTVYVRNILGMHDTNTVVRDQLSPQQRETLSNTAHEMEFYCDSTLSEISELLIGV